MINCDDDILKLKYDLIHVDDAPEKVQ